MATHTNLHYTGVVPDDENVRTSVGWKLGVAHTGAEVGSRSGSTFGLLGGRPTARLTATHVLLEADSPSTAVASATIALDRVLIAALRGGDMMTLVGSTAADVTVSLARNGTLAWAVGAVSRVSLADGFVVHIGPAIARGAITANRWPATDTWLDVSTAEQRRTVREGETAVVGDYTVTLRLAYAPGEPGTVENAAISRTDLALHEAAIRAAQRLDRFNGGLLLTRR